MSESSSAILDLKDESYDEPSQAGSLAAAIPDGSEVVAPLIMDEGYDIAVKVDAPMKQLSTLETYVTYRVRCVCARWPTPTHVRRRYNHFKVLHKRLVASNPLIGPPPLPPLHSARQQLDRYDAKFVALRSVALDAFLNRVAKHPILTHSEDFKLFLTTPDEDLDKIFKNDSSAMNLWGLGTALYGNSEPKPTNGARVKDPEFSSATDYLLSLQAKLTTLNSLTNKLNKGTTGLSTELNGMKTSLATWSPVSRPLAVAAAAVATAAGTAAAARQGSSERHAAVLPLLAAYCGQHVQRIRQRDNMHSAYVSGNASNDLHNKLEQASEALRSELSDWQPKTRQDIKSILLEIAEKQILIQQQTLLAWETAHRTAVESSCEAVFKTVSKNAVQNLSPSKVQNHDFENATERDLDDFEIDNDLSDMQLSFSETNGFNGENLEKVDSEPEKIDSGAEKIDSAAETFKGNAGTLGGSVELFDGDAEKIDGEVEKIDEVGNTDARLKVDSNVIDDDPLRSFAEIDLNI